MLILGISGVATSGKDTLLELLQRNIPNYTIVRFALADTLKQELDAFCIKNFGISAFTTNKEEKKIIRDLLVAYGKIKRIKSNGTYWTSIVSEKINNISPNQIPVVTDIRYDQYKEDELYWLKEKHKGKLIHVRRVNNLNGEIIGPANNDEAINDPKLISAADFDLIWPTMQDNFGSINIEKLGEFIKPLLQQINQWIKEKNEQ